MLLIIIQCTFITFSTLVYQALLQASGKVKQSKTTQRRPPSSKKKEVKLKDRDKPPATEVNKVVDEFFEVSH